MFNDALLNSSVQEYIRDFDGPISTLAFAGSPFDGISTAELIQQIESRQKAVKKLPTWFQKTNILYPAKLNIEQTSSEITANYKASLITGHSIADITGGFGVDSYFFSEKFETVHHFEINSTLSEIAAHNFRVYGKTNIQCFNEDGLQRVLERKYDAIYADPSRRHESKGKVFFLQDCQPNIPANLKDILDNCNSLLLKTSPMLDITIGIKELDYVSEIHIVAVDNEVKELLWLIKKGNEEPLKINTINFTKTGKEELNFNWESPSEAIYSLPQKYLYEPNAAILKSGAFELVSQKLGLDKLHKNTHLYTGDTLVAFPGRKFKIENVVPYTKSEMRKALTFTKANISIRNFPETVATLRKKWKIADGGKVYLFFITNREDKKEMLICSKV